MPTNGPPVNARFPLIVVRREFFEQFKAGTKTVEYRRHRKPFTLRAFYPGRWVRIAYNYDVKRYPSLLAMVHSFEVMPVRSLNASEHQVILNVYPDLKPDDELALIKLVVRPS